jgi:glutamine amidotransferase
MIKIIDYGLGNINAFINSYKRLDIEVQSIKSLSNLKLSDKLILPGVGHFDSAIRKLSNEIDIELLNKLVLNDETPILGVCVGMQIMLDSSQEGVLKGLGWFNAKVKKIPLHKTSILPHMGWNKLFNVKRSIITHGFEFNKNELYYLHSYYCDVYPEYIIASTNYGENFPAIINKKNIFGIQGHPEKSHEGGVKLLNNFSKI